jgi:zinc/manganese transport system substrate-binding protein
VAQVIAEVVEDQTVVDHDCGVRALRRAGLRRAANKSRRVFPAAQSFERIAEAQGVCEGRAQQSGNNRIAAGGAGEFSATRSVNLLEAPASLDRANGDVHAGGNPHIQTDPRMMIPVSRAMAAKFAALNPGDTATYTARQADFEKRWTTALAGWTTKAAPLRGVPIAVQHHSWSYLEAWLGLIEVTPLEPKPGVPPSSGYLAQVLQKLQSKPVKMVIRAAYEDDRPSAFIAEKAHIPAVALPFTIGGSDQAKDLFSLYDDTINRLLAALK